MKNVLVNFKNGNQIRTAINGTDLEIHRYYAVGKVFNIGSVNDDLQPVANIIIEPDQYLKAIVLIGKDSTIDVITEDGGYCAVFLNEENLYDVTMYQDRININTKDWHTEIAEGKAYCNHSDKGTTVNELIIYCLEYLGYNILETDLRCIFVQDDKIETVTPHIVNFLKQFQCQSQD